METFLDSLLKRWAIKALLFIITFLYASGYFSPASKVYKLPVVTVHELLSRTPLPPIVLGDRRDDIPEIRTASPFPILVKVNLLPPHDEDTTERDFEIDAQDPNRIIWTFKKEGEAVLSFVATTKPYGADATQVWVDVVAPEGKNQKSIEQRHKQNKTIKNLYVTAMREQVSAVLENRDFNLTSIYPAMMAAASANLPQLQQRFNRAIEADQKRIKSNIERAYERESAGE